MRTLPGEELLLQVRGSDGTFLPVTGMRLTGLGIQNESVDVTDQSSRGWRTLLSGAGLRTVELSAAGIFLGGEGELRLRSMALSGGAAEFVVTLEKGRRLRGNFVVGQISYEGLSDDETTYRVSLASASAVTLDDA